MKSLFVLLSLLTMQIQGGSNIDYIKAIEERHSVRYYTSSPLTEEHEKALNEAIKRVNEASGLNFQLVLDDPKALSNFFVTYGRFKGVKNYIALVGPKSDNLWENVGYFGEILVLECQAVGLNTCWVGGSYSQNLNRVDVGGDEEFVAIITVGYGTTQGIPHQNRPIEVIADGLADAPQWYIDGVNAALLGPSALNKQNFHFSYKDGKVKITPGNGHFSKIDVGIAKLHFELGSGKGNDIWEE